MKPYSFFFFQQCIDAVKAALKLQLLGEQQTDIISEELLLDLGRALYKLHFQLLLFVESANKMTSTLTTTLKTSQVNSLNYNLIYSCAENMFISSLTT